MFVLLLAILRRALPPPPVCSSGKGGRSAILFSSCFRLAVCPDQNPTGERPKITVRFCDGVVSEARFQARRTTAIPVPVSSVRYFFLVLLSPMVTRAVVVVLICPHPTQPSGPLVWRLIRTYSSCLPHVFVTGELHGQGEKCSICGHKGKGKVYQMLTDMPCEKGLNFRFFDQRTNKQWFKGYWALARIIRR